MSSQPTSFPSETKLGLCPAAHRILLEAQAKAGINNAIIDDVPLAMGLVRTSHSNGCITGIADIQGPSGGRGRGSTGWSERPGLGRGCPAEPSDSMLTTCPICPSGHCLTEKSRYPQSSHVGPLNCRRTAVANRQPDGQKNFRSASDERAANPSWVKYRTVQYHGSGSTTVDCGNVSPQRSGLWVVANPATAAGRPASFPR